MNDSSAESYEEESDMPDEQGNDLTDEDEAPDTPLHAHDEGREEDVVGNPEPEVGEEGDLDKGPAGNPVQEDDA